MAELAEWTDTCSRCGSSALKHGVLRIEGDVLTQTPMSYAVIHIEGIGNVRVQRALCLDCGNVELYIKPDIKKTRITKTVNRLRKEFENWPRKDKIPVYVLAAKLGMKKSMLKKLLPEV
ncbi:MAG: hypothetical protein ACXACA_08065, partial [Candidatus Ranarchaeia archaeon]